MKIGFSFYAILFGVLIVSTFAVNQAYGAAYIKFDGIDGEAIDDDHKSWIDVLSFEQTITKSTSSRSVPVFDDIKIEKELDKSSPKLAESVVRGKMFPSVIIEFTKSFPSGQQTYFAYELKNVMITSYLVATAGTDFIAEEITLNFEEIKVTYTEHDSAGKKKGNVEYSWKVEEGES